jgi:transcriptional regulator with XRE-family HTH domain
MKKTLKEWRKERGFSQEELARRLNVSTWTVGRYESEGLKNAKFETVINITEVLDIELDNLVIEEVY